MVKSISDEWVSAHEPFASSGTMAVAQFFGISWEEKSTIFHANFKMTPKQKAREIERLVEKYGYVYAN